MFKRPAWATSSSSGTLPASTSASASNSFTLSGNPNSCDNSQVHEQASDDSSSLFRHAARTHDAVIAGLTARQRKENGSGKKSQKSRANGKGGEKRRSSADTQDMGDNSDTGCAQENSDSLIKTKSEKTEIEHSPNTLKKRRINAEDVQILLGKAGFKPIVLDDDDTDEDDTDSCIPSRSQERSPSQNAHTIVDDKQQGEEDNEEEGEDEVEIQEVRPVPRSIALPEEDDNDNDESDPELLELRRKARERHKRAESKSATPGIETTPTPGASSSTSVDPDPVMQILITSPIPNTNPLIVQRRLSQRLQEVRLGWCQKQGFSDDVTATVFLTFCGRRKYDVTAVKSLGLAVDALGTVTMRNGDFREEVDRIHLEAMTEELLAKQKAEQQTKQQQQQQRGPGTETDGGDLMAAREDGEVPPPQQQQQYIRLVIKAKGQDDFKVKVTSDTVISKIVNAARHEFKIPSGGAPYLEFDGERLDPQEHVKDTEIEDMMCLDFYPS